MHEKVTVFSFKSWDRKSGNWIISSYKLPIEGIITVRGFLIEGSEENVLESDLNEYGKYFAPKPPLIE